MEDKKRDLDIFKLALKDLVYKAVRDFGYQETLKVLVNIAIKITDDERAKVLNKEEKKPKG